MTQKGLKMRGNFAADRERTWILENGKTLLENYTALFGLAPLCPRPIFVELRI